MSLPYDNKIAIFILSYLFPASHLASQSRKRQERAKKELRENVYIFGI